MNTKKEERKNNIQNIQHIVKKPAEIQTISTVLLALWYASYVLSEGHEKARRQNRTFCSKRTKSGRP
jgi:hypothetical protein